MKDQELNNLYAELAQREFSKRSFAEYLVLAQGKTWKLTRMSDFLANKVQ